MKLIDSPKEIAEALGKYRSGHAATNTALRRAQEHGVRAPLVLKDSFDALARRHAEKPLDEEGRRLLCSLAAYFEQSQQFGLGGFGAMIRQQIEPGLNEVETPDPA